MKLTSHALIASCLISRAALAAEPALTIYNQDFAVVRETVPLNLKSGVNQVSFVGATAFLEPSSIVLRDPAGKRQFQILEQNYRADPVSLDSLLTLNEGKTIQFEVVSEEGGKITRERIYGKIIRSGVDARLANLGYYGYGGARTLSQPIIEINGQLRFSLPGQPLFPALADDTILKPTLVWEIEAAETAKFDAELSYVTGGMSWSADYNLVLPERGDTLDLVGWVTMNNQSGKSFKQARVKLMAGDVNKIQNVGGFQRQAASGGIGGYGGAVPPPVTEKSFDEYHLYTVARPTTLLDRETKQVEFVHAAGVKSSALYVYDGVKLDQRHWYPEELNTSPEYGVECNQKIMVTREFTNSAANHLGLPLPKGKLRLYRRNSDGQMEFTGENTIDHTPKDELIRISTGNAFDLVGERKRTEFRVNFSNNVPGIDPATGLPVSAPVTTNSIPGPWVDETFEITLRNHKQEKVEVRVVEHLYRWSNWQIARESSTSRKIDAQTIEFPVEVQPDGEQKITYTVHYSW
jgi:hypothetical protein